MACFSERCDQRTGTARGRLNATGNLRDIIPPVHRESCEGICIFGRFQSCGLTERILSWPRCYLEMQHLQMRSGTAIYVTGKGVVSLSRSGLISNGGHSSSVLLPWMASETSKVRAIQARVENGRGQDLSSDASRRRFIACCERICINSLNHLTLLGAWSDRCVPSYPERRDNSSGR
jgi:hypothetical protein